MPYCCQCGVELDKSVKQCPLCDFTMPDFAHLEEHPNKNNTYPEAANIYHEIVLARKSKALFVLAVMEITAMIAFGVLRFIYPFKLFDFLAISFGTMVVIVFFALGFLKPLVNLFGSMITATIYLYVLAKIIGSYEWYYAYALPIIAWVFLDGIVMYFVYKRIQSKNKIIDVPVVTLLYIGLLALGLEGIIGLAEDGVVSFSWSLIVAITVIGVTVLITGVYHGLPVRIKEELTKFFHI